MSELYSAKFSECGQWFYVKLEKLLLVFSRAELTRALRRGKAWRRHGRERLKQSVEK